MLFSKIYTTVTAVVSGISFGYLAYVGRNGTRTDVNYLNDTLHQLVETVESLHPPKPTYRPWHDISENTCVPVSFVTYPTTFLDVSSRSLNFSSDWPHPAERTAEPSGHISQTILKALASLDTMIRSRVFGFPSYLVMELVCTITWFVYSRLVKLWSRNYGSQAAILRLLTGRYLVSSRGSKPLTTYRKIRKLTARLQHLIQQDPHLRGMISRNAYTQTLRRLRKTVQKQREQLESQQVPSRDDPMSIKTELKQTHELIADLDARVSEAVQELQDALGRYHNESKSDAGTAHQLQLAQDQVTRLQAENTQTLQDLENARVEAAGADQQLTAAESRLKALRDQHINWREPNNEMERQLTTIRHKVLDLEAEADITTKDLIVARTRIAELEQSKTNLTKQAHEKVGSALRDTAQAQQEAKRYKDQLQSQGTFKANEVEKLQKDLATAKQSLKHVDSARKSMQSDLVRVLQDLSAASDAKSAAEASQRRLQNALMGARQQLTTAVEAKSAAEANQRTLQLQLDSLRKQQTRSEPQSASKPEVKSKCDLSDKPDPARPQLPPCIDLENLEKRKMEADKQDLINKNKGLVEQIMELQKEKAMLSKENGQLRYDLAVSRRQSMTEPAVSAPAPVPVPVPQLIETPAIDAPAAASTDSVSVENEQAAPSRFPTVTDPVAVEESEVPQTETREALAVARDWRTDTSLSMDQRLVLAAQPTQLGGTSQSTETPAATAVATATPHRGAAALPSKWASYAADNLGTTPAAKPPMPSLTRKKQSKRGGRKFH